MANTAHTPTPWQVAHGSDIYVDSILIGRIFDRGPHGSEPERTANAAHIVRCVNAHDALVAALRAVTDELYRVTQRDQSSSEYTDMTIADARAALAKAEG